MLWEAHFAKTPNVTPEWKLKQQMARKLVSLGIEVQVRDRQSALRTQINMERLSETERSAAIDSALKADLLCNIAWFNRGLENWKAADQLLFFLFAALSATRDLEAWVNVFLKSIEHGDAMLSTNIALTALFYHEHTFIGACVTAIERNGRPAEKFFALMNEMGLLHPEWVKSA